VIGVVCVGHSGGGGDAEKRQFSHTILPGCSLGAPL
jgi:hypothetical protein